MTMYAVPFASKKRITRTMFGWRKDATVRDSSMKRCLPQPNVSAVEGERGPMVWSAPRCATSAGRYSLTATLRLRLESSARYVSPKPPTPSTLWMRYSCRT